MQTCKLSFFNPIVIDGHLQIRNKDYFINNTAEMSDSKLQITIVHTYIQWIISKIDAIFFLSSPVLQWSWNDVKNSTRCSENISY